MNMIHPTGRKTFKDYALMKIIPFIEVQLEKVDRVDIVWDIYTENSLKTQARIQRGKGVRRMVADDIRLPHNWQEFLRDDKNKADLFELLAVHIATIQTEKKVMTTYKESIMSANLCDKSSLAPCFHEEADTRIFVHVADAVKEGHQKFSICTVDTDVVILAISFISTLNVNELWVAFGTGHHFRYIPTHLIDLSLGTAKSRVLPLFHAYTGCDTVLSFSNRGKKTTWDVWKTYDKLTDAFHSVMLTPGELNEETISTIERFTVLLYNRTGVLSSVDAARMELFFKKGRSMEDLPPTKDALMFHICRSVFQAAFCWGRTLDLSPELPCPSDWDWSNQEGWQPVWTTLPHASKASHELIRCGCQKGCRCAKAAFNCKPLCHCGGDCAD